jgi:hypothetical protein
MMSDELEILKVLLATAGPLAIAMWILAYKSPDLVRAFFAGVSDVIEANCKNKKLKLAPARLARAKTKRRSG